MPVPAMPGANCRPPLASNSSRLVLRALKPRSRASRAARLRSSRLRTAGRSITLPSNMSAQRAAARPIDRHPVAQRAAEQLIDRNAERLALDVETGIHDRSDGVRGEPAGGRPRLGVQRRIDAADLA